MTTLAGYIDFLSQCALLTGLQKYAGDEARRYSSVPKFQVYNNELLTAYKGRTFEKDRLDGEAWGRLLLGDNFRRIGAHRAADVP